MDRYNIFREFFTPVSLGVIISGVFALVLMTLLIGLPGQEYHVHADIAVFANGQRVNLTPAAEISVAPCVITEEGEELPPLHFVYSSNGKLIHAFDESITYSNFFASLGMTFEDDLLIDDLGNIYKPNAEKEFKFYVDNTEVDSLASKIIENLDRVMITYGDIGREELTITKEIAELSSEACLAGVICPDARDQHNPCAGLTLIERVFYFIETIF